MKVLSFIILLFITSVYSISAQNSRFLGTSRLQTEKLSIAKFKDQISKYDFSTLFTCTDNSYVYGFIGDNYQRIRIKIISVTKDSSMPKTYKVYGKSMVKNNVDEFHGTIIISNISRQNTMSYGVDDELKNKGFKGEFIISGAYIISENANQNHSGVFNGTFRAGYYLDKEGKFHYDDINNYSDGYMNNEFIGKWTDYKTHLSKICNWGDYRIPNSGDFDIGAGDFSPADKYLPFGWESVRDYSMQTSPKYKQAKKVEEVKWWQ